MTKKMRRSLRRSKSNSHCIRLLWRISLSAVRRATRRVSRRTATAWLSARAHSLQSHGCTPHQLPEIQLHVSAIHLTSLPRFSAYSTPYQATLNTRKAWRQQGKAESALPKQFRSGNTSDNAPFDCFSWIRIM